MTNSNSSSQPARPGVPTLLLALIAVVLIVGLSSTFMWLYEGGARSVDPQLYSLTAASGLILCIGLTTLNLFARWFRWQFLLRRLSRQFLTRESLMVFLATLPAIATPFFLGELVRITLLKKKVPGSSRLLFRIWVAERALDAAVLVAFYFMAAGDFFASSVVLIVGAYTIFRLAFWGQVIKSTLLALVVALPATIVAWSLPIIGLYFSLILMGAEEPAFLLAVESFSSATLLGALSGIPLGVSLVGSSMIAALTSGGVAATIAITTVFIHRAGSVWFAVILGLGSFLVFRNQLSGLLGAHPESHFDDIVDEYTEEIPEHVRVRLLDKKANYIQAFLARTNAGNHGLDLGCGQGWYAAELTRRGLQIDGVDYSNGQVERAKQHLAAQDYPTGNFQQADARQLPFADNSFDFAYSINAIHHIISPPDQRLALAEVVRVLKPGGVFLLNEMNTYNPLFRLYMSYLFPLIKKIDEGNEAWILPTQLPLVRGAHWRQDTDYFTFLPDFIPRKVQQWLGAVESWLEGSRWRKYSAHYQACLVKDATDAPSKSAQ